MIQFVSILSFIMLATACGSRKLSPQEYFKWAKSEDNGLTVIKEEGGFTYSLQYRPLDLILLQELGPNASEAEWNKLAKEFDGMQYYSLKIEATGIPQEVLKVGASSEAEYQKRIHYCNGGFQKDISLISGTDTSQCKLYHFERMFQVAPYISFSLGFEKPENNDERTIRIYDRLFSGLILNFHFDSQTFANQPKLQLR
jgi:hypothetical protein